MAEARDLHAARLSRRQAGAVLLVGGLAVALPALANGPKRAADGAALRAAAEFAMSF